MSRQSITNLENQLSTTRHELELATFLNKGILQTNTEYKLRIAELENENLILSKAESNLSKIEDKLENSEKANKKLKKTQRLLIAESDKLLNENQRLNKEVDNWKDRYSNLRNRVQELLNDEIRIGIVDADEISNKDKDRNSTSSDKRKEGSTTPIRKFRPTSTSAFSKRRSTATQSKQQQQQQNIQHNQPIASNSKISLSPVRAPNRATSKKRRRVEDSTSEYDSADDELQPTYQANSNGDAEDIDEEGEEQEEEESGDPLGGSYPHNTQQSPPSRTYTPRSRSKINTNNTTTSTNTNKKRLTISKKRDSNKQTVLDFKVKDEPISPGNGDIDGESDSDDDPLAMV